VSINPIATKLATTNFKGLFRKGGAFRNRPRKSPINTSAAKP